MSLTSNITPIAIVGMACLYPDARSPLELWENVLSKRRAFRRIPPERLPLNDYFSPDHNTPDTIYSTQGAFLEGYEFDRLKFKVVGDTFRAADLTHWLALDIAEQALTDAGLIEGKNLPKETTGVLLGNTLTGEFSRANTLRLRWPYVRSVIESQLIQEQICPEKRQTLLTELEEKFKAPFTPIGEESLAGNLSNTIAGRICNHFDLKGGGYVLDGACSSSLLAVANGCSALVNGDLDVVLAGGIDLSLDPFELVGFAKAGALTDGEMRVYDAHSSGFIPGEGCGLVVLMRYEDALAQNCRIYGLIRGWGISSDGQGGITRPEVEGQLLALKRAYHKAGFTADTVAYFEGHGTGTPVGDATELQALNRIINGKNKHKKAVIGSIKANIGHTKAAAGIAGLIKATMAIHSQILPPTTGCETPHPQLNNSLKMLPIGQVWTESMPLRAGISAMGFGGINTHLVIEGLTHIRRRHLTPKERELISTPQDGELLLLSASTADELKAKVDQLLSFSAKLSRAEVGDLGAHLAENLDLSLPVRAAIVTHHPEDLTRHLENLQARLTDKQIENDDQFFFNISPKKPRIGFLFPGQAAPVYLNGGMWEHRFSRVKDLYSTLRLPLKEDIKSTAVAQPAIIAASVAGLQVLEEMGITADVALGHSLGELVSLYWGSGLDQESLLDLARFRGKIMAELGDPTGTMASIGADENTVKGLLNGRIVTIAALNSPSQTVISGEVLGVNKVIEKAKKQGLKAIQLPVSHAFHSPLISKAVGPLREYLEEVDFLPLEKRVISTVTGSFLKADQDMRSLLMEQIISPVCFIDAVTLASQEVDLFIEVGPGQILGRLLPEFVDTPVISLDVCGQSLQGLLKAIGAVFVLGYDVALESLFKGRFTRPFNLDFNPKFLENPCSYYRGNSSETYRTEKPKPVNTIQPINPTLEKGKKAVDKTPLDWVRELVSKKTELPLEMIKGEHRLLGDLHLNSISVGQLVAEAARSLGVSPPVSPTDYAGATVAEIAEALQDLGKVSDDKPLEKIPRGVDSWVRVFKTEWIESPLKIEKKIKPQSRSSRWNIIAQDDTILSESLREKLENFEGEGVIICLPPNPSEEHLDLLLEAVHPVPKEHFILIQHQGGAASFARTFYLENPHVKTCVVDLPIAHPDSVEWIFREITANPGYTEAYYNQEGQRFEPVLQLLDPENLGTQNKIELTSEDVLLVTGGGKGIAAECALSIAQETGVKLALLGRSDPTNDPELSENLSRMKKAGIELLYLSVDVTDQEGVKNAIAEIESALGTITAIIHGAGINRPKLLTQLEKFDFLGTLAPKVRGLDNLLSAITPEKLRVLVTFGSIIARMGLAGEADYGLANEWLSHYLAKFQADYPHCRCLNLEWSVWSGAGMGERLGRIDSLISQGITPISPDLGISILRKLMGASLPAVSLVVSGRFGEPPTLKLQRPELPLLRFLETPKVYYPGIELVVDVELSLGSDPYLNDHIYQGEPIFPAVMGLEAMTQVAIALMEKPLSIFELTLLQKERSPLTPLQKERSPLTPLQKERSPLTPLQKGGEGGIVFKNVQFNRPIVVSADNSLNIRISALKQETGALEIVIRSEQTAFAVDHFRAILSFSTDEYSSSGTIYQDLSGFLRNKEDIFAEKGLYGSLFFHKGRFQRLQGYHHLHGRECIAEISPAEVGQWFSAYLPQNLVLGDAAARDTAIHALQACIPHATILPNAIEEIAIYSANYQGKRLVYAKERQRLGEMFIYDLDITDETGTLLEQWQGLYLQVISHKPSNISWFSCLVPPYLERRLEESINTLNIRMMVDLDDSVDRRLRSDRTLQRLTGTSEEITRRTDGKPDLIESQYVSVAHSQALTLAIAGYHPLACDIEPVQAQSPDLWCDLLTTEGLILADRIASETQENLDTAATRVWCASECLKKVGAMVETPLSLEQFRSDGAVWFRSGEMAIASFLLSVKGIESPLIVAILVESSEVKGVKNYELNTVSLGI